MVAPDGKDVRPTLDRVRENIFNILNARLVGGFSGKRVLDVFAGSGAMGLEALSRGAARVTFIENAAPSVRAIQENIRTLRAFEATTVLQQDASNPSAAPKPDLVPCDVVFLDPPYGQNLAAPALIGLARQGWLATDVLCVVETGKKEEMDIPAGFELVDERKYGAAKVRLLQYTASD